jgi:hypothetical protein
VIDTLDHKPSVDILRRAVKQEERHVEFGEQQTVKCIEGRGWMRRRLLGLSLVSMWGVKRLARYMEKRLPADASVLRHLPAFLDHANHCAELRLRRIGLLDRPLALGGDADDVAAAVVGVAAALDPAVGLEVVEQEDQVVRVHVQGLAELLLQDAAAVADVAERPELLDAHAEDVLRAAPVHHPREPREQHHRPGSRGCLHPLHGA